MGMEEPCMKRPEFIVTSLEGWMWMAYDRNTYDGPGSVLGVGESPADAVADFWEKWEERYEHSGI
jgi:hypothetical protein